MAEDGEEESEEEKSLESNANFEFLVQKLYDFVLLSHDLQHLCQPKGSDTLVP